MLCRNAFGVDDLRLVQAAQRGVEAVGGVVGRRVLTIRLVKIRQQSTQRRIPWGFCVSGLYAGDLLQFVWRRRRFALVEQTDHRADQVLEQGSLMGSQGRPKMRTIGGLDALPFAHKESRTPSNLTGPAAWSPTNRRHAAWTRRLPWIPGCPPTPLPCPRCAPAASAWWRAARCNQTTSGRHTSHRSSG